MGPACAAARFLERTPAASRYEVTLQGSLAATGRGHFTDKAVKDVLGAARTRIVWRADVNDSFHPNGLLFTAFDATGRKLLDWQVYSVGGGAICERGGAAAEKDVYRFRNMEEIVASAVRGGLPLWQIVEDAEGPGIWDFLHTVYDVMMRAVERGLTADGVLPGGLRLARGARAVHQGADAGREDAAHGTAGRVRPRGQRGERRARRDRHGADVRILRCSAGRAAVSARGVGKFRD
jgi:L-serine dehydratase